MTRAAPLSAAATPKGTNRRDIDPGRKLDPAKQKIAYYHANMMPPPDEPKPVPIDRKAALAAADAIETPDAARARKAQGGPMPAHYAPTAPSGRAVGGGDGRVKGPFESAKEPASDR